VDSGKGSREKYHVGPNCVITYNLREGRYIVFLFFSILNGDATRGNYENLAVCQYCSTAVQNELGYSLETYDESPGVYYDNKGVANLYNVEWKPIVHVNLDKIHNRALALRRYLHHIDVMLHSKFQLSFIAK
jgi:hypothetical protein